MRIYQEFLIGPPNLDVYLLFPSPSSAAPSFLNACFYWRNSFCTDIPISRKITELKFLLATLYSLQLLCWVVYLKFSIG